jgi:hypothetical protein
MADVLHELREFAEAAGDPIETSLYNEISPAIPMQAAPRLRWCL